MICLFFFFQAEDGIRDIGVTGVQTCALPISYAARSAVSGPGAAIRATARATGSMAAPPNGVGRRGSPDPTPVDRESVVEGKSGDLGGRRIIKKKKTRCQKARDTQTQSNSRLQ